MPKFEIFAGLGGGFGGAESHGIVECKTQADAEREAYDRAWEEYESYGGYHGLDDYDTVKQDLADHLYDGDIDAVPDDEADQAYVEQVEGWIEYYAVEVTSGSTTP